MDLAQATFILSIGYLEVDDTAKLTWLFFRQVQDMGPLTSKSIDRLAKMRGVHPDTIRRHIAQLEAAGLLSKSLKEKVVHYDAVWPDAEQRDYIESNVRLYRMLSNGEPKSASPTKALLSLPSLPLKGRGERGRDSIGGNAEMAGCLPSPIEKQIGKPVSEWTAHQFASALDTLYVGKYRHRNLELDRHTAGAKQFGIVVSRLKDGLIRRFENEGLTKRDAYLYLRWLFEKKADKLDISVGVVVSRTIQNEYLSHKIKTGKPAAKKEVQRSVFRCKKAEAAGAPDSEAFRFFDEGDPTCRVCIRRVSCSELRAR